MLIQVHQINDDGVSTIGFMTISGEFQCFTLEDTFNEPKVYGKTRIPEGSYEVTLRHEGAMVKKIKNVLKCEPKKEYKFTPEQIEKFKKACCWDETSDYRK